VVIADKIPAGLVFDEGLSSTGCVLNGTGTSVLCNNFNLSAGKTKTFYIVFRVENCGPTIKNSATVSSSSSDPNSSNNKSATVTTKVNMN